jgi:PAS domain S-box-containing protein
MTTPLHLLILEDRPSDAELTLRELRRAGFAPVWRRVETEADYLAALDPALDLILADYSMPQFDAPRALDLLRERELNIPFIIVSGTIGEEVAVAAMQRGATDYLLKDRLARLGSAVTRALQQQQLRAEKLHMDQRLRESEFRFRALIEHSSDGIVVLAADATVLYASPSTTRILGYAGEAVVGRNSFALIHPDDQEQMRARMAELIERPHTRVLAQCRLRHANGTWCWIEIAASNLLAEPGVEGLVLNYRDVTERMQAEQALREAETKYRTLVERIPAITYIAALDDSSSTLYVSPQVEQILGFSQAEWIGDPQRWLKQLHPRDFEQTLGDVARSRTSPIPISSEFRMLARDGRVVWFHDEAIVVQDDAGQPMFLQGVMFDITERKQAEQALAERVRLAALGGDVGLTLTTGDTIQRILQHCVEFIVEHLDAAFARIWTLNEGDEMLELQASAGIYPHRDGPHSRVPVGKFKIGKIAQEHRPHLTNTVVGDPDIDDQEWAEREGMVAFAGYPLIVDDRLLGVVALFSRKTLSQAAISALGSVADTIALGIERKRTEAALRQNYTLLHTVIEGSPDTIYVKDLQGRYVMLNSAGALFMGLSVDDAIGKDDSNFFSADAIHSIIEREHQVITSGEVQTYEETTTIGGSTRTFLSTKAPYRDYNGTTIGLIGISRDITERKRLEAQFLQAQKMESVGQLAGGVAHDFNNLLTAINGYAELALMALPADAKVRDDLQQIVKSASRAATLTRQLLAFARKQIMDPYVLNLNALIVDVDKLLQRLIGENIELVAHLAPDLGLVKVDPGQIEQVLVNLAVNARDAMPEGGKLTIETHNVTLEPDYAQQHIGVTPGAYILVAISDTGTGMDAETRRRIFEPFFTTKEPGRGTGLGLATCYGIVKQHGGNIWAYSEPGHGTTFKMYLPRADAPAEAWPPHDDESELPRGSEVVLLVEDEPTIRELAGRVLRAQGYTMLEASDGIMALRVLFEHTGAPIDLVVTDIIMPQLSGTALVAQIKASYPGIKSLFMSGYTDDAIIHHGRVEAGIAFLQKPFSPAALARKVREVLDM